MAETSEARLRAILERNYNPREALELGLTTANQLECARYGLSYREYDMARKLGISAERWATRKMEKYAANSDEAQAIQRHRMFTGLANSAGGIGDAPERLKRMRDENERG